MKRVGGRLDRARLRRLALPVGAIALAAIVVGAIVGAELPASSKGASAAKTGGATTVEARDLVATDTESGTLGYANPSTVYNRLSGTITWLPSVGQEIKPGGTLYNVDNSPVVLFNGTTPAYRTLSSGVSNGPDVTELNQNLVNLGFADGQITVNDIWQAGTTNAVDRWQASLGETQSGTITLGQVVFLPGPQLITTVSTVLGSTGGGSAASGSGAATTGSAASTPVAAAQPQFVSLTTTTPTTPTTAPSTTPTTTTPTTSTSASPPPRRSAAGGTKGSSSTGSSNGQLQALIALLKAEIAELKSSRGSSGTGSVSSASRSGAGAGAASSSRGSAATASPSTGSGGGAASASSTAGGGSAQAVMQTTSTQQVVTVQLDATKQSEAVVGEAVTVQLPDGTTTDGKLTGVSAVAQTSSSSSSGGTGAAGGAGSTSSTPTATIPVTISLTGHTHVSGLDQAAVSVNFAQQKATNVLSVPVTALIATQGGGYAVQEAAAPHTMIPVTPGLFAAGYVQISGPGISPGLQVTDSQG